MTSKTYRGYCIAITDDDIADLCYLEWAINNATFIETIESLIEAIAADVKDDASYTRLPQTKATLRQLIGVKRNQLLDQMAKDSRSSPAVRGE